MKKRNTIYGCESCSKMQRELRQMDNLVELLSESLSDCVHWLSNSPETNADMFSVIEVVRQANALIKKAKEME